MVVHNQEEIDKVVYKELDDSLVRAAIATSSLEVEQDSGGGPRRQETIGDTTARTRFESLSKLSNDPLLVRGNTLRSGEDSLKLNELMELCSNLQTRVSDLEKTKTRQSKDLLFYKGRVRLHESRKESRTHGLKRYNKVSLTTRVESSRDEESWVRMHPNRDDNVNDADEDIPVNDQDDADMFDVNTLTGDEVLAEPKVVVKDVNLIIHEVTLAQALASLKSVKPKVKANVVEEPSTSTTTTTISSQPSQAKLQDKGKGILIKEPVKPKKKDLIRLDEQIASKLQAGFDEEERLAREKDEANLAQRLQAQEQEELTDKEKARLFVQFLEQRRKHFAAKRAEEKMNKPPTQSQQRKIMCTYLENMEGKKPKDLKNKSFDSIQKMFDKAFKRQKVDDVQETTKVDNDQEAAKIKELMEIIPNKEEVAIDAILLAVKPPRIVDWKIHKEGKKTYYQIIKADGSSKMYLVFSHMLKSFDREDLETLWKLIKAKHGSTRPKEGYKKVLWGDLKVMFEPYVEDTVWRNQQDYRVLD
ncbi:hypothetical protein Tco_1575668 [Tanacetum coccineum]